MPSRTFGTALEAAIMHESLSTAEAHILGAAFGQPFQHVTRKDLCLPKSPQCTVIAYDIISQH